jgi:hypothetical protein
MPLFTHVGAPSHVGLMHCGVRLQSHRLPKASRRHALNGGPQKFTALCGKIVELRTHDANGLTMLPNVRPAGHPETKPVTCYRCLQKIFQARADER